MNKKELRKLITDKRNNIPEDHRKHKSLLATDLFFKSLNIEGKVVMAFLSFGSEIDTSLLIERLIALNYTVLIPRVDASKTRIDAVKFTGYKDLVPGAYGILEPDQSAASVDIKDCSLIIMPGLAFDRNLMRMGYGGGYYDRFTSLAPDVMRCAFCFDEQIISKVPTEAHDMPVHAIVTDKEFIVK